MARTLSETMLKVLHALDYACEKHGRPGAKKAHVVAMYASMGKQADRTLEALERRGLVKWEVRMDEGIPLWEPTEDGRALLRTIAEGAETCRREEERRERARARDLLLRPRGRLSLLAERAV